MGARGRPDVCASAYAYRVLGVGWAVEDFGAGGSGEVVGSGSAGDYRSWESVRGGRVLSRLPERGDSARSGHGGLCRSRRPDGSVGRARGGVEFVSPGVAGAERGRLAQPDPALDTGAPGGVLLPAAGRSGIAGGVFGGAHRPLRMPVVGVAAGVATRGPGRGGAGSGLVPRGLRRPLLLRGSASRRTGAVRAAAEAHGGDGSRAGRAAGRHPGRALLRAGRSRRARPAALHRHQRGSHG